MDAPSLQGILTLLASERTLQACIRRENFARTRWRRRHTTKAPDEGVAEETAQWWKMTARWIMATVVRTELRKWGEVVKDAGIKIQ